MTERAAIIGADSLSRPDARVSNKDFVNPDESRRRRPRHWPAQQERRTPRIPKTADSPRSGHRVHERRRRAEPVGLLQGRVAIAHGEDRVPARTDVPLGIHRQEPYFLHVTLLEYGVGVERLENRVV